MRTIVLLLALLVAAPAFAISEWSETPDASSTTVPTRVTTHAYYRVNDTTDSGWLEMKQGRRFDICLIPDSLGTTNVGTVQIRRKIVDNSTAGSYVLNNVTLDGTWPNDCIYDVPGGNAIQVDVITSPAGDVMVVSVERSDG